MRSHYYRRILSAYLPGRTSQLTFWHDHPRAAREITPSHLGEYYMPFIDKAHYPHLDICGIPRLNYRGKIGWQYNPIAIAQYGLGRHTLFLRFGDQESRDRFLIVAGWLVRNLERTSSGTYVWNHHFNWEYRSPLQAPWSSGLAQGQGISLLVRAYRETRDDYYLEAARRALLALSTPTEAGGMLTEAGGHLWIEEYIVDPPTHILNGCLWASWGLYDYWLATGDRNAFDLFKAVSRSAAERLPAFDTGFWSLYEQSGTRMKMLASPFYHRLHIAQLEVMHQLTGDASFQSFALLWSRYQSNAVKRGYAFVHKCAFKILYY